MRPSIICFIALLSAACGRDAITPDAPESPAEPEGAAPAPEAEPEAAPADLPPLEPAEPGADGVFRGVQSALAQLTGSGPIAARVQVIVELRADGVVVEAFEAEVAPQRRGIDYGTRHASFGLADGAWLVQAWWPHDWSAHGAVDRGIVRILDGAAVIAEADFAMRAVPRAADACDPLGFANRCGAGQICELLPRPVVGQCAPGEIVAWRTDSGPILEVNTPEGGIGAPPPLTRVDADGRAAIALEYDWSTPGRYRAPIDSMDGVTIYMGAHRVEVPVRAPAERALGEGCDSTGVSAICAAGLSCSVERACIRSEPPTISAAAYNWGRVWATLHLRGRDVDGDLAAIELNDGEAVRTYAIGGWRGRADPAWHVGLDLEPSGDFELIWAFEGSGFPTTAEVVLVDREGNRSAPFAAESGFLEGRDGQGFLPEGALCDRMQSGFLGTCPASRCALADGESSWRCQPAAACSAPDDFAPIEGDRAPGTTRGSADRTWLPCAPPIPAVEGRHRLEAREDGIHRVRIAGPNLTAVALRSACDATVPEPLGTCSGAETVAGTDALEVERWMNAGDVAWLIVEAFGTVDYTVEVEVSRF